MAYSYWDGRGNATGSTTTGYSYTNAGFSSNTDTKWYYPMYTSREILVTPPKNWTEKDVDDYIILINIETKTGWIVTMVINGDVLIVDPTIETRTLKDFNPILKINASKEDSEKIDEFFKTHSIEDEKGA